MAADMMNYNTLVQNALRGVVRKVLKQAAVDGLPGQHHFYIGFRTKDPGVVIADHLMAAHPDEMTIVLQHQYWGLEVGDEGFEITLSFNRRQERLCVPFAAMSSFYDPSVQFGLQFPAQDGETPGRAENAESSLDEFAHLPQSASVPVNESDSDAEAGDKAGGNIVTLDTFRKK